MGRLIPKPRRANSDALSMHTTPDDYNYADHPEPSDLPPSYADSEFAASSSAAAAPQPVLPNLILAQHEVEPDEYVPVSETTGWRAKFELMPIETRETKIRIDERLQDPYHLYAYIMDYLRRLPPSPVIQIYGYHYEEKRKAGKRSEKETNRITDFNIEISLQGLLRHAYDSEMWHESVVESFDSAYRGSFRKTRAPGYNQAVQVTDEPTPDLKEWCERYCASPARLKVFRVHREAVGFDQALLTTLIAEMIRGTDYEGKLEVKFPTYDANVDIYSPHWANRWRTSWIRNLFYFSVLWILTWPILFFFTRWWCVYNVHWKSSCTRQDSANPARSIKTYAYMSERDWFNSHRSYLRHLVLQRFQGTADASPSNITEWNRTSRLNTQGTRQQYRD